MNLSLERCGNDISPVLTDSHVTLFEATDRLGGRIYTHHITPRADGEDPYFEAGAMRIPRTRVHRPTFDLIRYLNRLVPSHLRLELIPYIMAHKNNMDFVRGQKRKGDDEEYCGQSARDLLKPVIGPWITQLTNSYIDGVHQALQFDELSFRQYLRQVTKWPHEVIDFVEMMTSQTNQYDFSFFEVILQYLDFGTKEWATIKGGMSRLIDVMALLVGSHNIHLNRRVSAVHVHANGKIGLSFNGAEIRVFDKVIMAVPLPALQNISSRPRWSPVKEQAIRSPYYEPLYKMGLHFRNTSTTDLRIRWIIYLSHDLALHDLGVFFGANDEMVNIRKEFIQAFDMIWSSDSSTGGCMYLPGQFSRSAQEVGKPEGNIFFAGEHLSRRHAWLTGAIVSASAVVQQVLLNRRTSRL
ncbi:hypothetical protein BJY01DRAFT_234039 [Aspergillus pseudoustus]|uniref:Amine oxidase domain-containing protein n=1 Tax=Aspergillus pseudoustus TaxID=1810923 RepID=A0ABR4K798_9EURO